MAELEKDLSGDETSSKPLCPSHSATGRGRQPTLSPLKARQHLRPPGEPRGQAGEPAGRAEGRAVHCPAAGEQPGAPGSLPRSWNLIRLQKKVEGSRKLWPGKPPSLQTQPSTLTLLPGIHPTRPSTPDERPFLKWEGFGFGLKVEPEFAT